MENNESLADVLKMFVNISCGDRDALKDLAKKVGDVLNAGEDSCEEEKAVDFLIYLCRELGDGVVGTTDIASSAYINILSQIFYQTCGTMVPGNPTDNLDYYRELVKVDGARAAIPAFAKMHGEYAEAVIKKGIEQNFSDERDTAFFERLAELKKEGVLDE